MGADKLKILNGYACLGGNCLLWDDDVFEITAIEKDEHLAEMYQQRFPKHNVIVGDANEYLLNNFQDYWFIWLSPPRPDNSKARHARRKTTTPKFPDLTLYKHVIFLKNWFDGFFCVENVEPYYDLLIPAKKRGRHLFWTNFLLPNVLSERESPQMAGKNELDEFCKFHKIDRAFLDSYKGKQRKDKLIRNMVDYEVGKTILDVAAGVYKAKQTNQITMQL